MISKNLKDFNLRQIADSGQCFRMIPCAPNDPQTAYRVISSGHFLIVEQIRIVKEVLHSRRHSEEIHNFIKGVMVESYLEPGSQKIGEHIYGKSITDPCLGWAARL